MSSDWHTLVARRMLRGREQSEVSKLASVKNVIILSLLAMLSCTCCTPMVLFALACMVRPDVMVEQETGSVSLAPCSTVACTASVNSTHVGGARVVLLSHVKRKVREQAGLDADGGRGSGGAGEFGLVLDGAGVDGG